MEEPSFEMSENPEIQPSCQTDFDYEGGNNFTLKRESDTSPGQNEMKKSKLEIFEEKLDENSTLENEIGNVNSSKNANDIVNFSKLMKDLSHGSKIVHMTWSKNMVESMEFEHSYLKRLDELLKEASQIETNLKRRKDGLRQRLLQLTQLLQQNAEGD